MSEEPRYPDLVGKSIQRQVNDLRDYTVNLQRYVRWALSNIEPRNYSAAARKNLVDMSMTVTDMDGIVTTWKNELESTPEGLKGLISKVTQQGSKLENLTNSYNATALGFESLTKRVEANEGNITSYYNDYKATADGISQRVGKVEDDYDNLSDDYEGFKKNYSEFIQKYDQIGMTVVGADGKETKVLLSDGKLDLSGFATFASLKGEGTTTIDGSNIKTGTIKAIGIESVNIESSNFSTKSTSGGYTFETILRDGLLLSVRHTGNIYDGANLSCGLDPVEGLTLGAYGIDNCRVYASGSVLKLKGTGGIHFNDKAFPSGFSLSELNNNLKLSNFSNDAIAMATAYTTTADITGGKDIDMSGITEIDSVGVFSRARYSGSYGYGILCNKAGYYLVSAHLSIKSSGTVTPTTAIRKVVGGTSDFIAKATDYVYCNGSGTFPHSHQIPAKVVYLEANSYLSLYVHDSACSTTADGCHLTAVYLGI